MSTELQYFPGDDKENQKQGEDLSRNTQKEANISLPHTERPEGPFEHSGETSGQTKAEESEENKSGQE